MFLIKLKVKDCVNNDDETVALGKKYNIDVKTVTPADLAKKFISYVTFNFKTS